MAQINAQYPDLNQMFGPQSVMPAYYGMQQLMAAKESEKLNQDQARQDLLFKAQNQPLDLATKQANIDQTMAMLPGQQADSFLKQRSMQVKQGLPLKDEIMMAAKELANSLKEQDVKALNYEVDLALQSKDSKEVERGMQLAMLSQEVVREQAKAKALQEREMEKVRLQNQGDIDVARINAQSRENVAKARTTAPKGLAELMRGQSPDKAAMVYNALAIQAAANGDVDQANFYQAEAESAMKTAQTNLGLRAEANKVGTYDMSQSGMPTVQAQPAPGIIPATPQRQPAGGPIAAAVKAAGQQYEPDKFIYRISPDGKVQRKAK